jgi:hypothetical protein
MPAARMTASLVFSAILAHAIVFSLYTLRLANSRIIRFKPNLALFFSKKHWKAFELEQRNWV